MALHRRHAIQQDPSHCRTLRLGAQRGSPECRAETVGAKAFSRAAPQCVHSGGAGAGTDQGRRLTGCFAAAGERRGGATAVAAARSHVPAAAATYAGRRTRGLRAPASRASGPERRRPEARYTVDGHERRFRVRHRRGRDAGSNRHGAFWIPSKLTTKAKGNGLMNDIRKLAFIGGGNMAAALISGLTKRGLSAERLVVADPSQDQLKRLVRDYAVQTAPDNVSAVQGAEVVVLAVKP